MPLTINFSLFICLRTPSPTSRSLLRVAANVCTGLKTDAVLLPLLVPEEPAKAPHDGHGTRLVVATLAGFLHPLDRTAYAYSRLPIYNLG